jgi:signal transduction histidine kinase
MTLVGRIAVGVVLLLLASVAAAVAEPKRVLFLHSFGREFSLFDDFAAKLRAELDRQSAVPLDIYEASLKTARVAERAREAPFVEYLDALFAGRPLDLVITIGGPAAGFFQRHRQRLLFAGTPVLFSAVDRRHLDGAAFTAADAAVAVAIDLPAVIANVLSVLPQTNRIAVVIGNSPLERFWLEEASRSFQQFAGRAEFDWLDRLSLADMLRHTAALPPRSALFFALLSIDATGAPVHEERALAAIHRVANAPIFSYVDTYLGRGIVGGPLINLGEVSRQAAAAAVRILRGEPPDSVRAAPVGMGTPVFDARELRRWDIDERRLPRGSIVQFREPTLWAQYRWYVITAVSLGALQTAFIVVLLINGRQLRLAHAERRRAEEAAHELSGRLIGAQEAERSRLARELHDDVTQRLALLAIDAGREERKSPGTAAGSAMRTMREGLVRLSEDVHALSYRLHPSILEDLGLVEALKAECERLSRSCPIRMEARSESLPDKLPHDISLCLFRVTQEALRNIARHAAASQVEVRLAFREGGLELSVDDNGRGFEPARDRSRVSLGHASMRQRVHLLGGRLDIDSCPGRGTTIRAWVPLKGERRESPERVAG